MPFVIRLESCNIQPDAAERPDPLTGFSVPVPVVVGLTLAEKEAVLFRLRSGGGIGPDGLGRFKVCFADNRIAQADFPNLLGDGRCTAGTLTTAEPFPALVHLAYEMARVGNLLLRVDGVARPLAPSATQVLRVVQRWPSIKSVPSAAHLWALVAPSPTKEEEVKVVETESATDESDSSKSPTEPPVES